MNEQKDARSVRDLAEEIAQWVPGGPWVVETKEVNECSAFLARADGATVVLWRAAYGTRVECHGVFPRRGSTMYGRYNSSPTITCDSKRSARSLAGEIARRLLPKYLPLYAEAVAERDAWIAREQQSKSQAADLALVTGCEARVGESGQFQLWLSGPGCSSATITGNPGSSTRIDLRCDDYEHTRLLVLRLVELWGKQ